MDEDHWMHESATSKEVDMNEGNKEELDEVGHNFLVYGFLQCKDLSSSLHYLTTMISMGLKRSYRSLRKVISSPCDAGDLQKALELSQEMRFRGWIHDSAIQTSIVESLLLCGKVQEAETFLDRMGEESLTPDTINYDYLIKFFCQHGRLDNYEAWTPQSLAVSGVRHDTDTDTDTTPRPVSGLNLMCLTGVHVSMSVSCPVSVSVSVLHSLTRQFIL